MLSLLGSLRGGSSFVTNSLRFRSSASAFLNRTPSVAGNRKTWTWSAWVKRGAINGSANLILFSATGSTFDNAIHFTGGGTNDILRLQLDGNNAGVIPTAAVYRDPSAWQHIIIAVDTTQAVAANRVRIYVNGSEVAYGLATYPTQNYDTMFNSANVHNIGRSATSSNQYFDGYLTEVNFIDGQALTPASFGAIDSSTGVWAPRPYSGTYGTNGFYLKFADASAATAAAIGKDSSGNGNNWTPSGISVTAGATYDSMIDVPVNYGDGGNGRGNYCTWNPTEAGNGSITFLRGNLQLTHSNATSQVARGTFSMSSGKWYWEVTATTSNGCAIGIIDQTNLNNAFGSGLFLYGFAAANSYNGSFITYGASYADGDIIGVALDKDANTLTFYKNGISQGVFTSSLTSSPYQPAFSRSTGAPTCDANFGQRPFAYTPPAGFRALNTNNLPTPSIVNGANFMAATTYTGNATARSLSNAVNSVSFQPDLVWIKSRTPGATNHALFDSVRGTTKYLSSNTTTAETTLAQSLTAFGADGFSLGTDTTLVNANANSYVAWQWKESVTAGLDVVSYTGTGVNRTVAHNLGVAPKMVIVRCLNSSFSTSWIVWHSAFVGTEYIQLNAASGKQSDATIWNSAVPSSTVLSIGTANATNESTKNLIAYCFAEIAGFSRFGSYTGNGLADGPFVFCGFRPRFVMIKRTDAGPSNWTIQDTSRDINNVSQAVLYPNAANVEVTGNPIDYLSNGFKLRTSGTEQNGGGATYIFAAFAENPSKYALAR